ncbi:PTR2 domain-containing protein, partial [Cephalotus follicularis]
GMVLLWMTTVIPQARPPPCDHFSDSCRPPTTTQLLLLYSSFGLMSIGAGGIRSSAIAFGADQLGKGDIMTEASILESYFSWYYVATSVATILSVTFIVYIQDNMGWNVGFGVPAILMFLATLSFFLASSFYVKSKCNTSLLDGFAQVLVASYRNRHVKLPSQDTREMYYHITGSKLLMPSEKLRFTKEFVAALKVCSFRKYDNPCLSRFLNKACVIRNPKQDLTTEGRATDPWRLCNVEQVEELKSLFKVTPLWSTGIIISVTLFQDSIAVLLVKSMDRHIASKFEIPAGSFSVFLVISFTLWIALYKHVILPLASKIKGQPARLSLKQKMGIGLLFGCLSTAIFASVESLRREIAIQEGLVDIPQAMVSISAMWLLPHYVLAGIGVAFNAIGQVEFYYSELPTSMSSIASTLCGVGNSAGSLVASSIISTVDDVTKRGGEESWVSSNINKGHYDYYYWLLTGLSLANFVYFLACSKAYGPCEGEGMSKILDEGNGVTDE